MTAPSADRAARAFQTMRLAPGDSLCLEVHACEVVPPLQVGEAPPLVLRGRRLDAHGVPADPVQLFLPVEMVEGPMKRRGLLAADIPELPRGERSRKVTLTHHRLEVARRVVAGRGQITSWDVRPFGVPSPDQVLEEAALLADYRWAMGCARQLVAEKGQADGFAVGFEDVRTIANQLFIERRRSRQGRG